MRQNDYISRSKEGSSRRKAEEVLWHHEERFSNGVSFFFFFLSRLLSSLVVGLKGERMDLLSTFHPLRSFSYRTVCQPPIGTLFLHAIHERNEKLYGVKFRVSVLQTSVSSFSVRFLYSPSFIVFSVDTFPVLLLSDRASVSRGSLLRIILVFSERVLQIVVYRNVRFSSWSYILFFLLMFEIFAK